MSTRSLKLKKPLEDAIRSGHPWVFADAVAIPPDLEAGDVVDLRGRNGAFVARGTVEPDSALAFRAWTLRDSEPIDARLVQRRLAQAAALRSEVIPPTVTGYRLCNGENDGIPGLHCDLYDGVASLRTDGELGVVWEPTFIDAVQAVAEPSAVVVRNPRVDDGRPRVVRGTVPDEIVITEGDRRFAVDVIAGQKTGFFLDQRVNRDRVASVAAGRDVLNLFAYTGGFSVAVALAGARRVTTVDIAAPAVDAARRNFALNDIDPRDHAFVAADAFGVLAAVADGGREHDLIVVDPPSFAPRRKSLKRALGAYRKLNTLAIGALPPGGWLATASCSGHVRRNDFLGVVAAAARDAGRRLAIIDVAGAGPDHPTRPGFPEGNYLDFVLARVAE